MNSKDIRTLLLCKIHRGHGEAYKYICKQRDYDHGITDGESSFLSSGDERHYFTVGGFDALTTYKIASFDDAVSIEWMDKLAKNKKMALSEMTENVSYHPIHIISNGKDERRRGIVHDFWDSKTIDAFPFLVVTFVYGMSHGGGDSYEDALWKYLDETVDTEYCAYVVYNSIDLCDLVVLWRSEDIPYILEKAMSIGRANYARKTYSFVNIPLTDGVFDPCVEQLLSEKQGRCIDSHMRRILTSGLEESKREEEIEKYTRERLNKLFVCIRGAICDSEKFRKHIKSELIDAKGAPLRGANLKINFGENDFMITKEVNGKELYKLLSHFLDCSNNIDEACWHIFTEFQYDYVIPNKTGDSNPPKNILSKEYQRTLNAYRKINNAQFSWADALLELTNIHAHIDRLPVLHGPSYLIWGCLHVVNHYLSGEEQQRYPEGDLLNAMLKRSQPGLERFIQAWSQLTDQITKVDDVIFHRLGNTTAIYNTLSESILELYHLFLSKLSEALIQSDGVDANDAHCHSFLLAPTLSQRMRIKQVFKVDCRVLSEHQVYIIEFPVDYLYRPNHFIFQLAHECLHSFGRKMRLREQRLKYMQGFMAFEILSSFADLTDQGHLARIVFEKLQSEMKQRHEEERIPSDEERSDRESVYLKTVVKDMKVVIPSKILTQSMYRSLCRQADRERDQAIFSGDSIDRWVDLSPAFISIRNPNLNENANSIYDKINSCKYFFNECYADVMAIKLLSCSLEDYLQAFSFDDTLPRKEFPDQEAQFIERLAIVITAAFEEGKTLFVKGHTVTSDEIKATLYSCFMTREGLADRLYSCFDLLHNRERSSLSWPPKGEKAYFSANALRTVVDYLVDALNSAESKIDKFGEVRKLYSSVIKDGNFFSEQFYQYIFEYHKTIREIADV